MSRPTNREMIEEIAKLLVDINELAAKHQQDIEHLNQRMNSLMEWVSHNWINNDINMDIIKVLVIELVMDTITLELSKLTLPELEAAREAMKQRHSMKFRENARPSKGSRKKD